MHNASLTIIGADKRSQYLYTVMIGLGSVPRPLSGIIDRHAFAKIENLMRAVWDERAGLPSLDAALVQNTADTFNDSLKRGEYPHVGWPMPAKLPGRDPDYEGRDPLGLDVPAAWGLERLIHEYTGVAIRHEKIGADKRLIAGARKARSEAEALLSKLIAVTGAEGRPPQPNTAAAMDEAWERYVKAKLAPFGPPVSTIISFGDSSDP